MSNTLKRVTIALPKNVHDKAVEAAKSERRSLSKHFQVLVERDLGLIPQPKQFLKQAA
jgi:hypothetical protein